MESLLSSPDLEKFWNWTFELGIWIKELELGAGKASWSHFCLRRILTAPYESGPWSCDMELGPWDMELGPKDLEFGELIPWSQFYRDFWYQIMDLSNTCFWHCGEFLRSCSFCVRDPEMLSWWSLERPSRLRSLDCYATWATQAWSTSTVPLISFFVDKSQILTWLHFQSLWTQRNLETQRDEKNLETKKNEEIFNHFLSFHLRSLHTVTDDHDFEQMSWNLAFMYKTCIYLETSSQHASKGNIFESVLTWDSWQRCC